MHGAPPKAGGGLVQERDRAWVPPPHFTGHTPQSLHLVHFPFTENVYKKIIIPVMLNLYSAKLKLYLFRTVSRKKTKKKKKFWQRVENVS